MNQGEHEVLEHDAVRDPAAMASQRMARRELLPHRQENGELVPQGFEQARWNRRHEPSV